MPVEILTVPLLVNLLTHIGPFFPAVTPPFVPPLITLRSFVLGPIEAFFIRRPGRVVGVIPHLEWGLALATDSILDSLLVLLNQPREMRALRHSQILESRGLSHECVVGTIVLADLRLQLRVGAGAPRAPFDLR